jgi:AhpD family alkylhydroperoxidase
MDMKLRELISLGASVSAHCFPCFDYHLEQTRKLGIDEDDIKEAIRSGFMVMNGAGDKMCEKIRNTLPEFSITKNESCSNSSKTSKVLQNSFVRF